MPIVVSGHMPRMIEAGIFSALEVPLNGVTPPPVVYGILEETGALILFNRMYGKAAIVHGNALQLCALSLFDHLEGDDNGKRLLQSLSEEWELGNEAPVGWVCNVHSSSNDKVNVTPTIDSGGSGDDDKKTVVDVPRKNSIVQSMPSMVLTCKRTQRFLEQCAWNYLVYEGDADMPGGLVGVQVIHYGPMTTTTPEPKSESESEIDPAEESRMIAQTFAKALQFAHEVAASKVVDGDAN